MVRVSSATSVDVQRTRTMPATITLQRAHRITLWPKKRSYSSACWPARTSRGCDDILNSSCGHTLLLDLVLHLRVHADCIRPSFGFAAGEDVAAQRDRCD